MLIPPMVNHLFPQNGELNQKVVHRILGHVHDEKMNDMSRLEIIKDLPKRKLKRCVYHKVKCWICWKASIVNVSK